MRRCDQRALGRINAHATDQGRMHTGIEGGEWVVYPHLTDNSRGGMRYNSLLSTTGQGDVVMAPNLLFYQLLVVALVLMCFIIHVGWPDEPPRAPQAPLEPNKR